MPLPVKVTEKKEEKKEIRDWIIRIGDGRHFWITAEINTWGLKSKRYAYFFDYVREGDRLWFMPRATKGTLVAVATYVSHKKRTKNTPTNDDYGWILHKPEFGGVWDTELHYKDLYDLRKKNDYDFCTHIVSPCPNAILPDSVQALSRIDLPSTYTYVSDYYEKK